MKIPTTFKLTPRSVPYWVSSTNMLANQRLGFIAPTIGVIYIATTKACKPRRAKSMAETFWHEVTHAILHDMGDPRWKDETFVLGFSKRLNEVVHSAKFTEEN